MKNRAIGHNGPNGRNGPILGVVVALLFAVGCDTPVTQADRYPADNGQPAAFISTNAAGIILTNTVHFGGTP